MLNQWLIFRESFENFIVQDLRKSLEANIEVSVIILTVNGIECLSGYFVGKKSDSETFRKFIERYMPAYSPHSETLYKCIRNGLAHDYIIKEWGGKSFVFTRNRGEKHLIPVEKKSGWFYLNREQFAFDFLDAQNDFFNQVEHDTELFEKAMLRLNQKGFLKVFSFQPTTEFSETNDENDSLDRMTGTSTSNTGSI